MKTRDRILQAGLSLYNQNGVASVSNHHVAEALDISPGNLHYHVKNKQQLVAELIKQFEQGMLPLMVQEEGGIKSIEDLWFVLHLAFEFKEKYAFIFCEADYLVAKYPDLEKKVKRLFKMLDEGSFRLCQGLDGNGIIQVGSKEELHHLATNLMVIYTQWLNFRRFFMEDIDREAYLARGVRQVLSLFLAFASMECKSSLAYYSQCYLENSP